MRFQMLVGLGCALVLVTASSWAADTAVLPQLHKCLQRADELPDIAAAEAWVWVKNNGGADAHLCRAVAQANRGMHADAAREYWGLAAGYEKSDPARAALMQQQAGREFLRAKDAKNALARFTAALKLAPRDVDSLVGLAEVRMIEEKYWDALSPLNTALSIAPDDIAALRQRGRAWKALGNNPKAAEDFGRIEALTMNGARK